MSEATYPDPEAVMSRIESGAHALRECPVIDNVRWATHGSEDYHPDVGEYWRPAHIDVSADMADMAVLHVLSTVMDDHGLQVHTHHGITESGDEWARLVVAPEGGA